MPDDDFPDHQATSVSFLLEIDGVEIGTFKEVSGLEVRVEVENYAEGGENGFTHKLPGRMSWPNLIMRRGVTKSDNLFKWLNEVSGNGLTAHENRVDRATGAVTLLGSDQARLRSWEIEGAFPVRWKGPDLSSNTARALDEEIEIAHEGFRSETHI